MRRIGLVLVAVALPTVAALADDRPPMKPTRDATVTYKTVGADGEHMIKMSFSAQTGLIRSDMPNMQGYMIVDRIGLSVLRDPYSNNPYVTFHAVRRVGGGVVDFDAIKFLKFA